MLGTGWFAAVAAEVGPGKTVAVVGDGAVGLLGVLSAKQLGAEQIIAMSRHESRQELALDFGPTDIVTERGDEGIDRIKDLTGGPGAHCVIEAGRRPGIYDASPPGHFPRRPYGLRASPAPSTVDRASSTTHHQGLIDEPRVGTGTSPRPQKRPGRHANDASVVKASERRSRIRTRSASTRRGSAPR